MTGNENALKALQQIVQSNPQLKNVIEQMIAAKQGGGQEVPAEKNGGEVSMEQEYYTPNELKCGGKVKKGEKGLPIPSKKVTKNAKGGCPCKLHRVGGKIVEVDSCSGMPIRRSGGKVGGLIDKKEPGGALTSYGWSVAQSRPEKAQQTISSRKKITIPFLPPEPEAAEALPVIGPLDENTGAYKIIRTNNPYQFNAFE